VFIVIDSLVTMTLNLIGKIRDNACDRVGSRKCSNLVLLL